MVDQHSADIDDILTFWFEEAGPSKWFGGGPEFEEVIKTRFESLACKVANELKHSEVCMWEDTAKGSLAAIIALDQFSRNIFRDKAESFAWDPLSLALARRTIARGIDMELPTAERSFIYMPFMHSENIDDQNLCVELMTERVKNESNVHHAIEHRKLIEQFGRFPHRNAILGRESTQAEELFLADGGYTP